MNLVLLSSIWVTYCIAISILSFFGVISLSFFIFLFILPFIVSIAIKVAIEYKLYGKGKVFCFSKKGTPADRKDILLKSLQSQMNSRVFITNRNPKMIVIVNSNGTYLYSFEQVEGTLFEKENTWYLKRGKETIEYFNPIEELEVEEKLIEDNVERDIYGCLVLDSSTFFQKGTKKHKLLTVGNAPFYLCRTDLLKQQSEEEIQKIVEIITTKLNYRNAFEKEDDIVC